jgi:Sulfatase
VPISIKRYNTISVLCAFALAQPLLDILSKQAEFFVIRRSFAIDVLCLLGVLLVFIPTALFGIEKLVAITSKNIANVFAVMLEVLLFSLILFPLLNASKISLLLLVVVVLVVSLMLSFLIRCSNFFKTLLNFASPAPILFAGVFLFSKGVYPLVFLKGGVDIAEANINPTAPVVWVIFDELPLNSLLDEKLEIDKLRYPGFAEIAASGYWFRNASTVSSWTEHAVPAILAGKYPDLKKKQMPYLRDFPVNLFTLLGNKYEMRVWEQVTQLCPSQMCKQQSQKPFTERMRSLLLDSAVVYLHLIFPEDWKVMLPSISTSWGDFAVTDTAEGDKKIKKSKKGLIRHEGDWSDDEWLFNEFLNGIQKSTKPSLDFVHITFPHVPYRYLPSGKKYARNLDTVDDRGYVKAWGEDEWPGVQQYQRYLLQLSLADKFLVRLVQRLKEQGMFDEVVLVISTDHGTSFKTKEYSRRVSQRNASDVMLVPLMIKVPQQNKAVIDDRNIETIDILPSVLGAAGAQIDSSQARSLGTDGSNVFDPNFSPRQNKYFFTLDGKNSKKLEFGSVLDNSETIKKNLAWFGDRSLFSVGTKTELHGKSLKDIERLIDSDFKLTIDNQEDFHNVGADPEFIPAMISGVIEDYQGREKKYIILVLVNGVVRASTANVSNKDGATNSFMAMVPEESFVPGENKVEAFILKN